MLTQLPGHDHHMSWTRRTALNAPYVAKRVEGVKRMGFWCCAAETSLDSRTSRQNPQWITKTSFQVLVFTLSFLPTRLKRQISSFPNATGAAEIIEIHLARSLERGSSLTQKSLIPVSQHLTFQPRDVSTSSILPHTDPSENNLN